MRKSLLAFVLLHSAILLQAQTRIYEQYASSVISFSTQFNATDYSASQILGPPDRFPACSGDLVWAPSSSGAQREFIVVGFAIPQPVNTVRIYHTRGRGGVDTVYLRNASTGTWETIYSTTAAAITCNTNALELRIPTTAYNVDAVRIAVNSPAVADWQEFDAIGIANFDYMTFQWQQYGSSVLAFSSQYSTASWSAQQALGAPNSGLCNDDSRAWCPATADGQREFLELRYAYPAKANRVRVFQQYNVGAVDTIFLRDAATGTWHKVFDTTADERPCPSQKIIEVNFTRTTYDVDAVRIALNSPAAASWNEIDAIELVSDLPGNAKFTVQTGNWSNPATWSENTLPTSSDTVVIGSGHNITVDGNVAIKSLFVINGGTLTLNNAANKLTLGPSGGGREFLQVYGTLSITNGTVEVNGHAEFQSGSTFSMAAGNFIIDGNDGTSAGSVANEVSLLRLHNGMASVAFTGGMLTIVDPQYHASGQAITGNYTFGASSVVRIGNGVSTTGGNNPDGFGGTLDMPTLGDLIIDAVTTGSNRHFGIADAVTVQGNLTVVTGSLRPRSQFRVNGSVQNNASITLEGGSFSVLNHFTNNPSGIYNVTGTHYTSIGDDLVNDGSFTSNWLYMASNFGVSANEQTISGSGTFNIFGLEPINNHPNGVTLTLPLTIQQLYFSADPGRLFLGNNDLTIRSHTWGFPNNNAYVVINGAGRLIIENITVAERNFPVGTTSYTPVSIEKGNGHTFAVSVRTGLTNPAFNTSVVNREWNITDMTGGPVAASLTFQWNAADENPGFDRNHCYGGHYNGMWRAISPYATAAGTNPYTRTISNVTGFSPFAIGSNGAFGGALPVRLTNFMVKKCGTDACVQWSAENEVNVSLYEVERSRDGVRFEKAGSQPARNSAAAMYELTDRITTKGTYYYRLKSIDRDGKFAYSTVARLDFNKAITVYLLPNPVKDRLHIQGSNYFERIRIVDANGKLVKEMRTTPDNNYHLQFLKTGLYWIQLINGEDIQTQKLVKE